MKNMSAYPLIIPGGMGVNISDWFLARTVSMISREGTLSGVALEQVMVALLQRGDPGEHIGRALTHFPFPHIAKNVYDIFYVEGGLSKGTRFKNAPVFTVTPSDLLISLVVCANFAFVWLAKEGHDNPIGINYLEKLAMPHIYAITGAMLADVDIITMGAGIALQIPEVINNIAEGKEVGYKIPINGRNITTYTMSFDPKRFFGEGFPLLKKPRFMPIVSSNLLASIFVKKLPEGSIHGFRAEEDKAGGHNAPPRKPILDEHGEPLPIYGPADEMDYPKIARIGLPFWIGGAKASPEKLTWALSVGAQGIQVGSILALCEQSGMNPELRRAVRKQGFLGQLKIRTDMRISPTGFPFKVALLDGTLSEQVVYDNRVRVCKHGALVSLYERGDGSIGYRCAAEPVTIFTAKGGDVKDTVGRGCVCSGLLATAGLDANEVPLITLGDDFSFLPHLMTNPNSSYSARDAIKYLLGTE